MLVLVFWLRRKVNSRTYIIPSKMLFKRQDRDVNNDCNLEHLLRLSVFDESLMLQVNWPVADTIHP